MEALIAAHSAALEAPLDWQKDFSTACDEPPWILHVDKFDDVNDQQLQPSINGMSLGDVLSLSREHPDLAKPLLGHAMVAENSLPRKIKRRKKKTKLCSVDDLLREIHIPNTIPEVLRHEYCEQLLKACEEELDAHAAKKTWDSTLVPRTSDMNVVGSTWSFDIKRDMKLKIARFKARSPLRSRLHSSQGNRLVPQTLSHRAIGHLSSLFGENGIVGIRGYRD